jgi:pimeloyl-ACP methyl ester carboxylesterase
MFIRLVARRLVCKTFAATAICVTLAHCACGQGGTPAARISAASRVLPLTDFYNTPTPLPAGKPGALIRSEPSDDYRLSYKVTAYRILYHSQSADGNDVAVSGTALLPEETPPAAGWPIVAWAHGWDGCARECAPSLRNNLNEGSLLSMYVGLGYAVVASDYAGLGTSFTPAALDIRSNATDVINSIAAAQRALPQLGKKWIVAGYGQGSQVAIAVAEAQESLKDANYLGAIGIADIVEPREFFEHPARGPAYPALVFLARGIKSVYPEFRVEDMLTEKGMRLYEYVGHSCDVSSGPVPEAHDMLRPGWESERHVRDFFARNALGEKAANGPLLLLAAENDPALPFKLVSDVVERLCTQKSRVLLVSYPAESASAVVGNSIGEQVSWIRARFSGLPAPSNCR